MQSTIAKSDKIKEDFKIVVDEQKSRHCYQQHYGDDDDDDKMNEKQAATFTVTLIRKRRSCVFVWAGGR